MKDTYSVVTGVKAEVRIEHLELELPPSPLIKLAVLEASVKSDWNPREFSLGHLSVRLAQLIERRLLSIAYGVTGK
jgi:hypothetical protein